MIIVFWPTSKGSFWWRRSTQIRWRWLRWWFWRPWTDHRYSTHQHADSEHHGKTLRSEGSLRKAHRRHFWRQSSVKRQTQRVSVYDLLPNFLIFDDVIRYLEGPDQREADEPLHFMISAQKQDQVDHAKHLCNDLLATVQRDRQKWEINCDIKLDESWFKNSPRPYNPAGPPPGYGAPGTSLTTIIICHYEKFYVRTFMIAVSRDIFCLCSIFKAGWFFYAAKLHVQKQLRHSCNKRLFMCIHK